MPLESRRKAAEATAKEIQPKARGEKASPKKPAQAVRRAMRIDLPYPVGSNRLWRNAKGRTIVSPEATAWKAEARWRAQAAGVRPLAGPVVIELTLHPRLTTKGRASQTRLDVDAPIKLTLDALQGVAYANDKQVVRVSSVIGAPIPGGGLSVSLAPWPAPTA